MSRSKYGAIRTEFGGIVFASKAEARYAAELMILQRAGEIVDIEYQPSIELVPRPNLVRYVADFLVTYRDGRKEWIDVKGMETPVFRLKMRLLRHFRPEIAANLRIVK